MDTERSSSYLMPSTMQGFNQESPFHTSGTYATLQVIYDSAFNAGFHAGLQASLSITTSPAPSTQPLAVDIDPGPSVGPTTIPRPSPSVPSAVANSSTEPISSGCSVCGGGSETVGQPILPPFDSTSKAGPGSQCPGTSRAGNPKTTTQARDTITPKHDPRGDTGTESVENKQVINGGPQNKKRKAPPTGDGQKPKKQQKVNRGASMQNQTTTSSSSAGRPADSTKPLSPASQLQSHL
jgi:hypothetical protein